jgi:uncharacterized protein (UPF0332 family)
MDPREFLELASEWSRGTREAEWRSAVSRAYYAAFHVARSLFLDQGFVVPQAEQAHAYLWLRLANVGQPDIQRAGNDLSFLRRRRNWADYDLDQPLDEAAAVHEVLAATDIVGMLETLRTSPAVLTRVTEAIKAYERDVLQEVTWQPPA